MAAEMRFQNASASRFELDVARLVRLLEAEGLRGRFSESAVDALGGSGLKMVAFETVNEITNRAASLTKETGLVSIWVLGMLCAGPETVVIVPYKPGEEADLGPVVKSDYFGPIPAERLKRPTATTARRSAPRSVGPATCWDRSTLRARS
jgi:hypothetical protein